MGKKVKVDAFCDEKEAGNPYYIRAFVDKETKQVKCQSARRVRIHYKCLKNDKKYCKDAEVGCFLFKEQLAKRLKLVHNSLGDDGILKCYFDVRVDMNITDE